MTPGQADAVLDALIAGWPGTKPWPDDMLLRWAEAIAKVDIDPTKAVEIAQAWATNSARFPSLNEVLARLRWAGAVVAVPPEQEPPPRDEIVRAHLAEARRCLGLGKGAHDDV